MGNLKSKILKGKVFGTDTVAKAVYTTYKKVTLDTTLIKLNRILDKEHFALVVHQQRLCKDDKQGILIVILIRRGRTLRHSRLKRACWRQGQVR